MTEPLANMARQFSRAAPQYDALANVQQRIAQAALTLLPVSTGRVLDIGCGTGRHTAALAARGAQAHGMDVAAGMVRIASSHYPGLTFFQGDAHQLPVAPASFDQVFSSMALQWCSQRTDVLRQIKQALKPGGVAGLNIMVAGSFGQLSQARRSAGLAPATNPLASHEQWLASAHRAGFSVRSAMQQDFIDHFDDILPLLRSIKAVGAGALTQTCSSKPLLRADLRRLAACYPRTSEQRLALTYRVSHVLLEH